MIRPGTRVLVVEDDPSISRLLQLELEHRGIVVRIEGNGLEALAALEPFRPDAVVLDILLPGMDGEHVLSRIRREGRRVPVIMLTARDAARDKIRNLNTGADDYLTKPFDIEELVARLGAVLRRIEPADMLRVGDLEVDADAVTVHRAGVPIELTAREFDLLHLLARNAGRVLSRDVILDRVWESSDVDPNVVDVYIGYLRRKIDGAGRTPLIRTVRGLGFTLRERDH
ncbi:MAG: response regulator transcription factor [Chloroflexota bacterium]|nr:response regulator transcription factor [Chloroflexota bacterium]